jgi:amidase
MAEEQRETAAAAGIPPFELDEVGLSLLRQHQENGRYTSEQLVTLYLERIAALDRSGPAINSVLEVNPDAVEIARKRDAERASGKVRGPLHGIPILLKDNIGTADRMATTAGSLALLGAKVPHDAMVAARLKNAGAVMLGKTNLSEWANFRSTHSVSGWSGRGGQTRNPYALDRTPGGSSSGSGSAAAACLAGATVGTETDGSILCPALSSERAGRDQANRWAYQPDGDRAAVAQSGHRRPDGAHCVRRRDFAQRPGLRE